MTSKNNYFYKRISILFAKKVELNSNAVPGGTTQIFVCLRVVQVDVDGSVCCSCEFVEQLRIVCRHILAIIQIIDEFMVDVHWKNAPVLWGGAMCARVTRVFIQALQSSLKKVKGTPPPPESQSCPV
jgi:hypothetical protein